MTAAKWNGGENINKLYSCHSLTLTGDYIGSR